MEIPVWLIMALVTIAVAFLINRLIRADLSWFYRLMRPSWLTFEGLIPFIWTFIFTCAVASATLVWQQAPGTKQTWLLMGCYLLLEIVTLSYTPLMCKNRSLTLGVIIGIAGFAICLVLAGVVWGIKSGAAILLLPYLLWSPVGTWVTWKMIPLNPGQA